MITRQPLIILLSLLLLLMVACESSSDDTTDVNNDLDSPLLVGDNSMPKQLVTVWFSPTPDAASIASPTPRPLPTNTPRPLPPTLTPTQYVGSFLGTEVSGTLEVPTIPSILPDNGSIPGGVVPVGGSTPPSDTSNCTTPVAPQFSTAYTQNPTVAEQLGCPRDGGQGITLVYQSFERGKMFWRDTRQIYALFGTGILQVLADNWEEGLQFDTSGSQPGPGLQRPIRGFGYAWHNNQSLRDGLGWATQSEAPISAFWQEFESGAMFAGDSGLVYAIFPATGTYSGPF